MSVQSGRGTGVFSKLQGLEYYFPENFRGNLTYYKSETFSNSSLHITFLNAQILGFLFSTKNSLTWEVKCENYNLLPSVWRECLKEF